MTQGDLKWLIVTEKNFNDHIDLNDFSDLIQLNMTLNDFKWLRMTYNGIWEGAESPKSFKTPEK